MAEKKISINTLLFEYSPKMLLLAILIGVMSGALYSAVVPYILDGIKAISVNENAAQYDKQSTLLFFMVVCFILMFKVTSVIMVNNIAKSASAELKLTIVRKINKMKISNVEEVGFAKLLNIINDDVGRVTTAAISVPMILVSGATAVGLLGYLMYLDFQISLVVLVAIVIGLIAFQIPVAAAKNLYKRSRVIKDIIQEGVRGLVMGCYELKLNGKKSSSFINQEIATPQTKSVRIEKIGDAIIHLAGTSTELLCFFVIGLLVFVLPSMVSTHQYDLYGIVMVLLYVTGPLTVIVNMMQHIKVGQIALDRINGLNLYEEEIKNEAINQLTAKWNKLTLKDVSYRYPSQNDEKPFSLSPVNLEFSPGNVYFIVGGNGSGKSTLSKLLSLHYMPMSGSMSFDNAEINLQNIEHARSRIYAIFSNYFLFNKLYQPIGSIDFGLLNRYLTLLELEGKTRFENGQFSTTQLSDGQRRRLALLVALLEDKEVYIFDEWAADQDPKYKAIFYQEILPYMKSKNKLVIVITHDDRYFDCADEVIYMENGSVLAECPNNEVTESGWQQSLLTPESTI